MHNLGCPWKWRVSLTEAGLEKGAFANWRLHAPQHAVYNDASIEQHQSEGGQASNGFATESVLFDRLSRPQASRLRNFIDDANSGTGWLYMTVDLNDDSLPGPQWVDIRGKPHRDIKQADAGNIVGRASWALGFYNNYVLFLNNVQIINNPSNYTSQ